MPDFNKPRSYPAAQLTRGNEPYHFQRDRQLFNKQPRPAQANTSQPNQKPLVTGWGQNTQDYWRGVYDNYLKRRGL